MAKQPTSVRLPDLTTRQLAQLITATGMTQSEVFTTAIDRMYQQEIKTMTTQQTHVIRIEPVTFISPFTGEEETQDYEVRQCITCGKEFHTPVDSSNTSAHSLYCGEHFIAYQKDFGRRMNAVNWDDFADEMKDGAA